jgi:hypothetical protein
MKKNRAYIKHQAFDTAHEELKKNPEADAASFVAPKQYHHAPDKLDSFKDYRSYFIWSNELYASSVQLMNVLRKIYDRSEKTPSHWYESKKKLKGILEEFDRLDSDLEDLYDDISEFQNCILATGIFEKQAQIQALSDQVQSLSTLENKITETCNRKLYEISSSRSTYANLFIALTALLVAVLSLVRPH